MPYVKFNYAFNKAYFKDADWRFIITQKVQGSGFALGISVGYNISGGFGLGGIPITFGGKKEKIEMFIDHLNGDFYWGERIVD